MSPPVRGELAIREKAPTHAENKQQENVSLLYERWKSINNVPSPHSCRGLMKYLLPEFLAFGVGRSCQRACPQGTHGALAISRGRFWTARWQHWSDAWVRAMPVWSEYPAEKQYLPNTLWVMKRVIGECKASVSATHISSLLLMVKHPLVLLSNTKSWITELEGSLEFMANVLVSQRKQWRQTKITHLRPHSWEMW